MSGGRGPGADEGSGPAGDLRQVSAITVTFNSGADAVGALRSVLDAAAVAGVEAELIVVDNASTDGSAELVEAALPAARILRNLVNAGFGSANNAAFRIATGDAWLLINPDATLEPAALGELLRFLASRPAAAIAAPTIRGPGRVESAGMHPSIRSLLVHALGLDRPLARLGLAGRGFQVPRRRTPGPVRVDWVSAAALVIRPAVARAAGAFDERIFLYGEDIDLCRRVRETGAEIWLVPSAVAHHAIGGSQPGVSQRWVDGLHDGYLREGGAWSRARTVVFDLVLGSGLGARAIASAVLPGRAAPEGARHRRRMAASARRAFALAVRVAVRGR